jgi:hypothetical protein
MIGFQRSANIPCPGDEAPLILRLVLKFHEVGVPVQLLEVVAEIPPPH